MKKVATISLKIIVVVFIGVCIGLFINYKFGLSTKYNSYAAKRDLEKGTIQLISYGLPLTDVNPISRKYGFRTIEAGCTVLPIEINGIKEYNSVVKNYLREISGADWETRYKKGRDSLILVYFLKK